MGHLCRGSHDCGNLLARDVHKAHSAPGASRLPAQLMTPSLVRCPVGLLTRMSPCTGIAHPPTCCRSCPHSMAFRRPAAAEADAAAERAAAALEGVPQ